MADCDTCQPENGFFINPPELPGVPVGRYVVPLARVNGMVQEMKPGMVIPPGYTGTLTADAIKALLLSDSEFITALQQAMNAGV